jgi:DNA-binding NarL/FixJ family response regulator
MRIILADHHTEPHWALKILLEEQPEFDLAGEAVDGRGLLILAKKHSADLVLLDSELPGIFIEDLIAGLHALEPRPIVIVMNSKFENSSVLLRAGADALVSKEDQPDWLLKILYKYAKQFKMEENAMYDAGQGQHGD